MQNGVNPVQTKQITRKEGRWPDGWIREDELNTAENLLHQIQEEIRQWAQIQPEITEEPFPVEVKITRGVISYKHPDMEHWARGKTLGTAFELQAIAQKQRHHCPCKTEKSR